MLHFVWEERKGASSRVGKFLASVSRVNKIKSHLTSNQTQLFPILYVHWTDEIEK